MAGTDSAAPSLLPPSFPPSHPRANVSDLLGSLHSLLLQSRADVLVLTDPNTIYYYLGYTTPGGSLAALVVGGSAGRDGTASNSSLTPPPPSSQSLSCTMVARDLEITNLDPAWRVCVDTVSYAEDDPVNAVAGSVLVLVDPPPPPPAEGAREGIWEGVREGAREGVRRTPTRRTPPSSPPPLRIGYEASSQKLSPRDFSSLVSRVDRLLLSRGGGVEWVDVSPLALRRRACKDGWEVECLRRAASYVSSAYSALSRLRVGMRATELAGHISLAKFKAGSEWCAYPEFVAGGVEGCKGHMPATRSNLLDGLVFTEVGASHARYHAARMHAVHISSSPPPLWFVCMERTLRSSLRAGRDACVHGARARDVDAAMRKVVARACAEDPHLLACDVCMPRRSGYSIGIGNGCDWADGGVRIDPTSRSMIEDGMCLHLVPWVQIRGKGAMGFSDTVLVGGARTGLASSSLFSRPAQSQFPTCAFVYTQTPPLLIPLPSAMPFTTLEGSTPLLERRIAGVRVFLKDERRRPHPNHHPNHTPNHPPLLFAEALLQMPSLPTHVFVQAGDGRLLATACLCVPLPARIVCCEPCDAACVCENVRLGRRSSSLTPCSGATDSDMRALNVSLPCPSSYSIICDRVTDFVVIGDAWSRLSSRLCSLIGLSTNATGSSGLAGLLASIHTGACGIDPSTSSVLVLIAEEGV